MKHQEVNLTDLARAFESLEPRDAQARREIAAALGLELSGDASEAAPAAVPSDKETAGKQAPAPVIESQIEHAAITLPPLTTWQDEPGEGRAVESELKLVRSWQRRPPNWVSRIEAMEEDPTPVFPLPHEPLIPERWARSVITESLSTESEQPDIDMERLIELLAKRRPLLDLPYLTGRTLRRGVQVLLDVSEAMEPFKRDQDTLVKQVIEVVGAELVDLAWFEHCPARGVFTGDGGSRPYTPPHSGSTVLLLTDLGVGRPMFTYGAASKSEWRSFARMTREAGCQTVCFVPYESNLWPRALASEMTLLRWEVHARLAHPQAGSHLPRPETRDGREPDPRISALASRNPNALELAKLLSLAARIEPELLRAARLRFLPHADAGAEADLWFSALVQSKSRMALLLIPDIARELREDLLADGEGRVNAFWEFLTNYREETRASQAIRLEEHITYVALRNRDGGRLEIETQLRRALKALVAGGERRSGLARWALSAIPLLPEEARELTVTRQLLWASKLRLKARVVPLNELPGNLGEVRWLMPPELPSGTVGVRLLENGIEISDRPKPDMHTISVPATNPRVLELWSETPSDGDGRVVSWRAGESLTVRLSRPSVSIRTITGRQYFLKLREAAEADISSLLGLNLSQATGASELDLSDMGLVELPEQIFNLTGLKSLRLSGNGLKTLPESIGRLKSLQTLNVSGNRLTSVPETIGQLSNLQTLSLAGNLIPVLPESIGQLAGLRSLDLTDNRLAALPKSLLQLVRLEALYLHGNSELELPSEVLGNTADDVARKGVLSADPATILDYYFRMRSGVSRPLGEAKLILVGRGGAGKTTLVKRLAGEEPDERESETHSISIRELTLDCDRSQVRARAWDFGGQEILHATHQFFLSERSLYLLVLEPRTGLAQRDAEYWLKLIETQGGGSPVIVVLNWSHGRRWQVEGVKLRRKFPFIVDFISTDALHGDGLEELRAKINEVVENSMPDVWLPFPERWREIKDAVSGMKENFLTYEQYTQLCNRLGEGRSDAQADLAGILHALGLALYFGRDPRLHDTRVLNPGWAMGGVYAVIRSDSVRRRDGQLTAADMSHVLGESEAQHVIKASDYPPQTHQFILDLMRAFQLCYASEEEEGKPTRYFMPELLPEFEPRMGEDWESAPVRLRYRYELLPPGFLPRFIVRTHALSEGAPHWRHGVVLRHAGAAALIRAETDRRELHVFALGGDDDARGVLVAMVRRELESLHAELRIQPVEELELSGDAGQWISVKSLREFDDPDRPTQKLSVQPEGTAEVNVPRELDKLIPAEARAIDRGAESAPAPVRLFVSYAHEDERQLKRLDAILDVLEQHHGLASWRDRRLIAGEEWDAEIRRRLEEADIFLFIASATSLVRPYIKDPELHRARERYEAGEIEVVTVKLEPCACDEDPFLKKLQRLAPKFKSIVETNPRSVAWEQVRKDLLPVIERVRRKKDNTRG